MVLQEKTNCEIILCGGKYSRDNALINTIHPQNILTHICTAKAFIAASGIHTRYGVTYFRFSESHTKIIAMTKAQ
ncbi:hypothetical protein [Rodentibacter haemolyticus]|uniref:DeoR-like transcriptional repressor C-terminal sensor domain-containing protein n=1 Tax=Rodentibacter haemolyticus TaxID=2778911 RepID=A0ABX6UVI4_9PAST|nr:hypothetical protein IHV77_07160 [Rodentibacter haemolyticus]